MLHIDELTDPLDVRLQRLADLHAGGHLSAQEFADAKRLILAPSSESPAAVGEAAAAPRRVGAMRWWALLLVAIVLGFMFACVAAAVTSLQRPAGLVLCSEGRFLAGNVVEHSVGATGYNIDAVCVADDGTVRALSQVQVLGVLWLEYAVVWAAVIVLVAVVWRAVRRSRRDDTPAARGEFG
jgi:ABC-type uncharacterized transport system permease subunit